MSLLDRVLAKPTPVFNAVSFLTTTVVWAIELVFMLGERNSGFTLGGAGAALLFIQPGVVINILTGLLAHSRGEYGGGKVAMFGVALWLVTWATLFCLRYR
jgi:hypothetical protein